MKINEKVIERALAHYGNDNQLKVAVEELVELSSALIHYKKDTAVLSNRNAVISEIADVLIITEYLKKIFGADQIQEQIDFKLERLDKRIDVAVEAKIRNLRKALKVITFDSVKNRVFVGGPYKVIDGVPISRTHEDKALARVWGVSYPITQGLSFIITTDGKPKTVNSSEKYELI